MDSLTLDRAPESCRTASPVTGLTVVAGHDGSTTGTAVVAHAAQRAGADGYLIVVHALPLGVAPEDADRQAGYADMVSSLLDSVDGSVADGASYEMRVVAGPASKALLEAAQRYDADEMILGAAANRRARGAIGRVADAVLRQSNVPVTIVPPRRTGRLAA
jgi:nucleotide-binding universal stress UspA family protein